MTEVSDNPDFVIPSQSERKQNPSLLSELKRLRRFEEKMKNQGMQDHGWLAYGDDIRSY